MNEHTAGHWEAKEIDDIIGCDGADIYDSENVLLAEITGGNPITTKANARLIASTPELLEALEEVLILYKPSDGMPADSRSSILKARNAIRKARGI